MDELRIEVTLPITITTTREDFQDQCHDLGIDTGEDVSLEEMVKEYIGTTVSSNLDYDSIGYVHRHLTSVREENLRPQRMKDTKEEI